MITRICSRFGPEIVAVVLLLLAFGFSAFQEPRVLDAEYLFDRSTLYMEAGILALSMTFVIIAGHIDLSVTSILALVGAICTTLVSKYGLPPVAMIIVAPVVGGALGALNGLLVSKGKLPSLVVTLATMALFRGVAQILLGDHSLPMPKELVGIHKIQLPGTYFHIPMVLLGVLAVIAAAVLHRTVWGRWVTALGTNAEAARHAGIPTGKILIQLFTLSGVAAGIGSMLMLSRLGVARFDHARGLELDVITAVVLGGASIFGGRGTIVGTITALGLVGVVQTGMGVAGVKAEVQVAVIGLLLIVSVLFSNFTARKRGR
jgi:rhamnose transport system permease protein